MSQFLFLVSMAFTAVQAFRIPAGTSDGVYTVSIDAEGNENHTLIASPSKHIPLSPRNPNPLPVANSRLFRRDFKVECYDAKDLDHADLDAANADLDSQCDAVNEAVPGHHNFYAIRGGAVAYFCNWNSGSYRCDSGT